MGHKSFSFKQGFGWQAQVGARIGARQDLGFLVFSLLGPMQFMNEKVLKNEDAKLKLEFELKIDKSY